jgi:hypothetical protein
MEQVLRCLHEEDQHMILYLKMLKSYVFAENLNAAKCLEEPTGETRTHKLRF